MAAGGLGEAAGKALRLAPDLGHGRRLELGTATGTSRLRVIKVML